MKIYFPLNICAPTVLLSYPADHGKVHFELTFLVFPFFFLACFQVQDYERRVFVLTYSNGVKETWWIPFAQDSPGIEVRCFSRLLTKDTRPLGFVTSRVAVRVFVHYCVVAFFCFL